jgi:hypothetical protein
VRRAAEPTRALATVLFTDIVDSTKLATRLGDRRWRELLNTHNDVARQLVEEFNGRIVHTTGDGILATFDGPGRGIGCAAALRDQLAGIGLHIRSGLHTGEVELRGDDVAPEGSMGWGLVPTYVGQQVIGVGSHVVTADQGKIDAQGAAPLAGNAGLDAGSVIYLDIENGGLMPANQVAYVTSWIGEVNANTDHWAGVYCSHFKTAKQVADAAAGVTDHDVATWRTGRSTADPRLSIWVLSSRGTQPARAMPRPSSGSTG